ncbi:atp-dependent rna helicase dbp3 [Holotrichia oblita]|uniref:Atp-dependent rna helicase dbp3 n=1 Tax=Holotrichia oblita TaxID=644536 RepID=A0ACB9T2W6_HOLOL|nr:atp-dependent rna helicase dbp3 [Holotrichia oblita]
MDVRLLPPDKLRSILIYVFLNASGVFEAEYLWTSTRRALNIIRVTNENYRTICNSITVHTDKYMKAQWAKLPPITKNFYVELAEVATMSKSEVERFRRENNNIVVSRTFKESENTQKPIPNPVKSFYQAFHNYPEILDEIEKVGFETPSPIQAQAWPILLSGEDLIGIAQTGTGKTLAFLLPALIHIDGQKIPREERIGPSVLVMAPTRELALQIDREVNKYSYKNIKAVCIYGGGSRREQVNIVTKGVDIVIATPGRLNDLVEAGYLKVDSITYVVLDEADRMLDMGFEPQIRKTMYDIRPDRQTVMTSATWPLGVRRLAQSYMVNPIQIHVGSLDLAAVHSVTQTIIMMSDDDEEKYNTFMEFVQSLQPDQKVIAFCGKKARASHLASELILQGIDCTSIHGDLEQCDREQALVDIGNGSVQILIATDVASRGIDIEDITHVINYDFPRNIEEYVHRVGRTGRAGRTGDSISYFTRADWSQAKELIEILEEANQYVPEDLVEMSNRHAAWRKRKEEGKAFANSDRPSRGRGGGGGGGGGRRW